MKRIKFFTCALALCAMGMVGYNAYQNSTMTEEERLLMANIEALSSDSESDETVKCYCKVNWFSNNICSAAADGSYCGGNPCSDQDANCR
ncbi:MAG: NVEALA domain-containing protein [Rikenellaceae bacterium]